MKRVNSVETSPLREKIPSQAHLELKVMRRCRDCGGEIPTIICHK